MEIKGLQVWLGVLLVLGVVKGQEDEEDPLIYQVQEGVGVGTYVGNVAEDAQLSLLYPANILSQLRYSLLDDTGAVVEEHPYLAINRESGLLTTGQVIDREDYCPGMDRCVMEVDVAISPAMYFQVISIQVDILDVNDNWPQFPQPTAYVEIPESAIVGAGFTLPLAEDLDGMDNSIASYQLRGDDDLPFELRVTPSLRDALSLELVVSRALDRELVAGYELDVIAQDGGNPPKSSSMSVNVTITDINDNHPVFDSERYTVQVWENTQVPQTVVTVRATDLDSGINGRIRYQLAGASKDAYGHMFHVDEDSGEITLLQSADREDASEFTLTVTARDRGAGSRLATTTVLVFVADVNDNPPTVNVNALTADGPPVISEGDDVGTFVALISVSDPDLGVNGEVTCLLDSHKFEIVPLPKRKYKIITAARLDRELQDVYNVTLSCHDNGDPVLVTEIMVTITVTDINDNGPVFTTNTLKAQVEENSDAGVRVAQVTATDRDIGINGQITYSLIGHQSHLFHINGQSGVILTDAQLDHESYSSIKLHVVATDNGEPALSANAVVDIKVMDVNDEPPLFTQDPYTFVIVENEPVGHNIGQIEAFDGDSSPFNYITYALLDVHSDSNDNKTLTATDIFDVNPDSGVISTKVTLDREVKPVYYLQATAGNAGYPGLTTTTSLTIFVADDNDNAPVIDFPNKENKTVFVSSFAPEGDIISQIRAHDLDTGNNAAISYSIDTDEEMFKEYFLVDRTSGLLYVNKDLSDFDYAQVMSKVTVTDHGPVPLSTQSRLIIVVDRKLQVIQDLPRDYPEQPPAGEEDPEEDNMLVIIIVVAVSGVLICVLLGAIVFVLLRSRRRPRGIPAGDKNNAPGTSIPMHAGSVENGNKYLSQEVEWMKGDPDDGSKLDSKVYYKNTLNKNNNKAGRNSPVVEEWEKNVLKHKAQQKSLPPTLYEVTSLPLPVGHACRGHHLDVGAGTISYVPEGGSCGTKRKRSHDWHANDSAKVTTPPDGEDACPDLDTSSASSGDMSNADSGRGASEEGDAPTLPIQDYKKGSISKRNQGSGYPRLSSFQSPAQMPAARNSTLPKPSQTPPVPEVQEEPLLAVSAASKQTVRNVKAKDKTKKQPDDVLPNHGGSYSILNNMLSKMEGSPTPSGSTTPNAYQFNDSNALFKYKSQNKCHTRRSSGTPSEMTDMTSTTSGSYMIHTDLDDIDSVRTMREVDV